MEYKFDFLNPHLQNTTQKIGFIITISLLIGLIWLHNPFSGYRTEYSYDGYNPIAWVIEAEREKMGMGNDINFLDWESHGAFSKRVSTIKEVIGFSSLILVFGIVWLWTFQDRNISKTDTDTGTDNTDING